MDAMVTARMPIGKKEAGVAVLRELGLTVSEVINALFNKLIETREVPWEPENIRDFKQRYEEGLAWVDSLPRFEISPEFKNMSVREAKARRLQGKLRQWYGEDDVFYRSFSEAHALSVGEEAEVD